VRAAATLADFEGKYAADPDPWGLFTRRDEAVKRAALLHALGPGRFGRVLELGAGAGANSLALADRALRLDATDGAPASVALIRRALRGRPRARAGLLALPAPLPRPTYDAIVVAELLYYLSPRDMAATARRVRRALRPGGRLVLAHHHVDFHDFAQPARGVHARFLAAAGGAWRAGRTVRNGRWRVTGYARG
jgi:SAM-dependent methyltransferase